MMEKIKNFCKEVYSFFFPKQRDCPAYRDPRWEVVDIYYANGRYTEAGHLSNEIIADYANKDGYCCKVDYDIF